MHLPEGYVLLNRYRIEKVLGQGGFGITYLANDNHLNRKVAVKELYILGSSTRSESNTVQSVALEGISFGDFKAKFIREAQELAAIEHRNIVRVYDHFEANNTAYFTMGYVDGKSLQQLVSENGPLPGTDAVSVINQLMDAVEVLHRLRKLHRDIKPANVMISNRWEVVLIDFGTARSFGDGRTVTSASFVSQGYSPNEQYVDQSSLDERSDIYSLGATLYFILIGQRPIDAPARMEQALAAPHEVNREVDQRTSAAAMKAMGVRRDERFQTVAAFREALKAGGTKGGAPQPPKPPQSPNARYLLIAAALVGVVLLGWKLWPNDLGQPQDAKVTEVGDTTSASGSVALPERQTGSALISSIPTGADVYLDGLKQGETPFTLNDLTIGEYAVQLKLNGYHDHTETLRIEAGKVTAFDHTLRPSRKSYEPEMVYVEGGTFTMGCTSEQSDCDSDERPTHSVTVSSFQMGKYEVTQAQWRAVMGNNPSYNSGCDNCPVENVNWNDVQDFIRKLNVKTGKNYRLPTEAEWEFAARGGNKSKGYKYAGGNNLSNVGWYNDNSGGKTHAVGQKQANELGIYDMSGNVWEWCEDWYGAYSSSPQTNPKGPSSGSYRVLRGGSWDGDALYCRVSFRFYHNPDSRNFSYGFRLVLP